MVPRADLLRKAYFRHEQLGVDNETYRRAVNLYTIGALEQDLGPGDLTTEALLETTMPATAQVVAREKGIVAGLEEFGWFVDQRGLDWSPNFNESQTVEKEDLVGTLSGDARIMLAVERTALNLLQRMSGIATETHTLVTKYPAVVLAATRKTHWGLLDHKAVAMGGGGTHRLGLWDAILIKENHLAALMVELEVERSEAIRTALERSMSKEDQVVEIEVESSMQALHAAEIIASLRTEENEDQPVIIMLDNMPPPQVRELVTELKENHLHQKVLLEVSGGIDSNNIGSFAESGVDALSMGALTHSARPLDLSLLFNPDEPASS